MDCNTKYFAICDWRLHYCCGEVLRDCYGLTRCYGLGVFFDISNEYSEVGILVYMRYAGEDKTNTTV